jgi:Fe-S cluster biogenesis protein NfuA
MEQRRVRLEVMLDDLARPVVRADGGDVAIVSADAREIVVRLSGACAGCPGAGYTMAHVVEPVLRAAWRDGDEAGELPAVRVERVP